jgi:hypothetical protein
MFLLAWSEAIGLPMSLSEMEAQSDGWNYAVRVKRV